VLDEMELWMFIRKEETAHQIKICPLAKIQEVIGRLYGRKK